MGEPMRHGDAATLDEDLSQLAFAQCGYQLREVQAQIASADSDDRVLAVSRGEPMMNSNGVSSPLIPS